MSPVMTVVLLTFLLVGMGVKDHAKPPPSPGARRAAVYILLFCLLCFAQFLVDRRSFPFIREIFSFRPQATQFQSQGQLGSGAQVAIDPTLGRLFSAPTDTNDKCGERHGEIAALNEMERHLLIRSLVSVLDAEPSTSPPLTSISCALGLAAGLEGLDLRLIGPLIKQAAAASDTSLAAAALLRRAKMLPAVFVQAELDGLQQSGSGVFIELLKQVPVDNFLPFAAKLASTTGATEIGYLIVLSHAPDAIPEVAKQVRAALVDARGDDRHRAALIAAANALPPSEVIEMLRPLVGRPEFEATLNTAIAVANDKAAFSPLIPLILDGWDPLVLTRNDVKVDTLARFGRELTRFLPLLGRKMLLAPEGVADWKERQLIAIQHCVESPAGAESRSCLPDITPPLSDRCEGRPAPLSERIEKIVQKLDIADPNLSANLELLVRSTEPAIREFAVHVLARMGSARSRSQLMALERDPSFWVAATAFAVERERVTDAAAWKSRLVGFLNSARSAGCLESAWAAQLLPRLGPVAIEMAVGELASGPAS